MVALVLNRRLNYRNIQLTADTKNQDVGYDVGDGEVHYENYGEQNTIRGPGKP